MRVSDELAASAAAATWCDVVTTTGACDQARAASHLMPQNCDCRIVMCSWRQTRLTTTGSVFDRSGCFQPSLYSSFPILVGKFFISLPAEIFFIPTGFWSEVYFPNSAYLILRSNCMKQISWHAIRHSWNDIGQLSKFNYKVFNPVSVGIIIIKNSNNARVIVENKVHVFLYNSHKTHSIHEEIFSIKESTATSRPLHTRWFLTFSKLIGLHFCASWITDERTATVSQTCLLSSGKHAYTNTSTVCPEKKEVQKKKRPKVFSK